MIVFDLPRWLRQLLDDAQAEPTAARTGMLIGTSLVLGSLAVLVRLQIMGLETAVTVLLFMLFWNLVGLWLTR